MRPDDAGRRHPFSVHSRLKSFTFAIAGLRHLVRVEHNARVHLAATIGVVGLSVALHISLADWRWIVLAIALVWITEALNTAIEALCDLVSPGYNAAIKVAKDVSAAAVLVASFAAFLIGVMTFAPYLAETLN